MSRQRIRPSSRLLRRLYVDEGLSLDSIGERLGYSRSWVRKQLIAAGIDRRPAGGRLGARRVDDEAEADLVEQISTLYVDEAMSLGAIGERLGRSRWWVRDRLDRAGVPIRRQGGPHSVRANPQLVEEMKRLYTDEKVRTADIADRVGMSQSWVYRQLVGAGVVFRRPRHSVDAERVRRLYVDERRSLRATALRVGVSEAVVRRVLVELGIRIRGLGAARTIHCGELRRLYVDEAMTTTAIAEQLGVTPTGVSNALRRCNIPIRETGTELTITTDQLHRHLNEGLSNEEIAKLYGVATWAVTRRLRLEKIRRPQPKPAYTRPSPPVEELQALYVDEGATLAELATQHQVPHATVRRWLDNAGINRRARQHTTNVGRRIEMTTELLETLYVDEGWTAAEIGRHVGVSKKVVLAELHSCGIPVRPPGPRRQPAEPVLTQLYSDPDVRAALRRHEVPMVLTPGPLRGRFPIPVPLTADLLHDLYVTVGMSAARISLLTGHWESGVRAALQQAGIAARDEGTRSPWSQR